LEYDEDSIDRWFPIWGQQYSSRKFYSHVYRDLETHPCIYRLIWKCRCTQRLKFFAWLIVVDRLNTKDMLQRRHLNIQGTSTCMMCNSGQDETIEHLFFECQFAQECWQKIDINWVLSRNIMDRLHQASTILDRLHQAATIHNIPCFTEAAIIASWELWKLRNDKVFLRRVPTLHLWFSNFKSQCLLQSCIFKEVLKTSFCVWLDAFS